MLQLLVGTNFTLMKHRRLAYLISSAFTLATVAWLVVNGGPRYSVDFTGGRLLQIRTTAPLPADQVRAALEAGGFPGVELQQLTGESRHEFMVRMKSSAGEDPFPAVQRAIQARFPGETVELRRNELVGPKVGGELRQKAIWAVLTSLGAILLYVGFRYEFKFALGAVVALFHDVFVTLGVLCFANREISLTVVAALLTIAGFSINDKIVVFDRIRERHKALRKEKHTRVMDIAVNETLSRTVITNITVLLTALALLFWGGDVLRDFSLAITLGMLLGTYSSIFLASALALDIWISLDRRKGIQAE
jgi:preprotein translocase subunit SecF